MFATVVAGIYPTIESAMNSIGSGFDLEYLPERENVDYYFRRFENYKALGKHIEQNLHHQLITQPAINE
ncbi:hypothetical protein [Pedobacter sp. NJ-S-72]